MTERVLSEQWALDLAVRIDVLQHRREIALASAPDSAAVAGDALKQTSDAVEQLLRQARAVITRDSSRWWRRGRSPIDHWRGVSVVPAFEKVHAAEIFLMDLLGDDEIRALAPEVVHRGQSMLDADDPRRRAVDEVGREHTRPIDRTRFKQAVRAGFQAEDQIFLRVRTFRNLVIKSTVLLFVLMVVMIWLVAAHPGSMPLCFTPDGSALVCPSGNGRPIAEDVMIVAGLGLLGSAAAAAFSIRGVQGIPTPYDIPVVLAFFKLPLGAFTAVTGLLLLGANFVPGLSALDSQRQILAYALTFGYAQQLVSRLVDAHARSIVSRLPSFRQAEKPDS